RYGGGPTGCGRLTEGGAARPEARGGIAPVEGGGVRGGSVTGVTRGTGSLAFIDGVSQNVAIMPNPPRKAASYPLMASTSGTLPPGSVIRIHVISPAPARKTGLTANRRISRAARAANAARPAVASGLAGPSAAALTPLPRGARA